VLGVISAIEEFLGRSYRSDTFVGFRRHGFERSIFFYFF